MQNGKWVCLVAVCCAQLLFAENRENDLKGIPESEHPTALIHIADGKMDQFKEACDRFLASKKQSIQGLKAQLTQEDFEKAIKDEQKFSKDFELACEAFKEFRTHLSNCIGSDFGQSSYGYGLFAQAYYDVTNWFIQFMEDSLFKERERRFFLQKQNAPKEESKSACIKNMSFNYV